MWTKPVAASIVATLGSEEEKLNALLDAPLLTAKSKSL
jgi:hypothetical protein